MLVKTGSYIAIFLLMEESNNLQFIKHIQKQMEKFK
mgnify:FL=1